MYCSIGKLEFEVEKISLVPNHIGGEIKSSLPKTYDGRAFDYILWLGWEFVNKNSFVCLLRGGRSGIFWVFIFEKIFSSMDFLYQKSLFPHLLNYLDNL